MKKIKECLLKSLSYFFRDTHIFMLCGLNTIIISVAILRSGDNDVNSSFWLLLNLLMGLIAFKKGLSMFWDEHNE